MVAPEPTDVIPAFHQWLPSVLYCTCKFSSASGVAKTSNETEIW